VTCCDERNCRRKTPIVFYRGDFSGAVYAVTKSHVIHSRPAPLGTTVCADQRHDVTEAMREFIRKNAQWVREVLEGSPDA
jgi:hypothetical protein